MNARGLAALVAGTAALVGLTGCGDPDSETSTNEAAASTMTTVIPPSPQLLAYAGVGQVGVFGPAGSTELAPLDSATEVESMAWTADGAAVAWIQQPADSFGPKELWIRAVRDGATAHHWKLNDSQEWGSLVASAHGVTIGQGNSRFSEYLPDGRTRSFGVTVPVPAAQREAAKQQAQISPPSTRVAFATQLEGNWLVAAQNTAGQTQGGAPFPIVDYEPGKATRKPVGEAVGPSIGMVRRLDDRSVAWANSSYTECHEDGSLGIHGLEVPPLPTQTEAFWDVVDVTPSSAGLNVVARSISMGEVTGNRYCSDDGTDPFVWFQLRSGAWEKIQDDVADVAVANDGRTARVPALVEGIEKNRSVPKITYARATVTDVAGEATELPEGTRLVEFSPSAKVTVRPDDGKGAGLSERMSFTVAGFGPLRLGEDVEQARKGTSTALTVGKEATCQALRVTDLRLDAQLGIRGIVIDGKIAQLSVSTRDTPIEEDGYALSDLQPGVEKVSPRGPKTDRGVRTGDDLNAVVAAYGEPSSKRSTSAVGAVDFVYRRDKSTFVIHADGSAVVRRMEWYVGHAPPKC